MERPERMSSGEAMRWNDDVERRRREYHEHRCAEDSLYRRAYERQQEERRRMKEMEEEHPYLKEINRINAQFDNEIIRMSGFEW